MPADPYEGLESLQAEQPIWERFFTIAPLVLIGTQEEDGQPDVAPKHMAFPLGWGNYFGFVCTPRHRTYLNIERTGCFTVSYPRPGSVVTTSLAASPRCDEAKPIVGLLETFPARSIDCVFVAGSYLYLECELDRFVDDFDDNSLIAGKVVAAHADPHILRGADVDDGELLADSPQLAYLYPGRFAVISDTQAFPFPAGMRR